MSWYSSLRRLLLKSGAAERLRDKNTNKAQITMFFMLEPENLQSVKTK